MPSKSNICDFSQTQGTPLRIQQEFFFKTMCSKENKNSVRPKENINKLSVINTLYMLAPKSVSNQCKCLVTPWLEMDKRATHGISGCPCQLWD